MRILFLAAALLAVSDPSWASGLRRSEFTITTAGGLKLGVREVVPEQPNERAILLLLHGAWVPGVPSFDPTVPGGSLAADLAQAGYRVYVPALRGYGRSDRPDAYHAAPEANPPMTRNGRSAQGYRCCGRICPRPNRAEQRCAVRLGDGGHVVGGLRGA